ncbi:MAG TPA: hypothetical protein DCQ12_05315, partial [Candidatus Cloacimonas sp.]|nr:hypothetical protein [Candidatus Cloacimonas sp.]
MAKKKRSSLQRKLQNSTEYGALRALLFVLRLLPWKLSRKIIQGLFVGIGYHLGVRRNVAYTQISKVYPDWDEKKKAQVLKDMYRYMGHSIASIYLMSESQLFDSCSITGAEHMREAYSYGKGVILATAHMGNWEAASIFPALDMPMSVIVRKQRNIYFDKFHNSIRARHGMGIIDMRKGLRDIIAAFKKNHMVAILMDQNAGKSGLVMDFLGFPASHWVGVAKLSLRYKVPILPGIALLTPEGNTIFS